MNTDITLLPDTRPTEAETAAALACLARHDALDVAEVLGLVEG